MFFGGLKLLQILNFMSCRVDEILLCRVLHVIVTKLIVYCKKANETFHLTRKIYF
jgi:hypothetical protein